MEVEQLKAQLQMQIKQMEHEFEEKMRQMDSQAEGIKMGVGMDTEQTAPEISEDTQNLQ